MINSWQALKKKFVHLRDEHMFALICLARSETDEEVLKYTREAAIHRAKLENIRASYPNIDELCMYPDKPFEAQVPIHVVIDGLPSQPDFLY